MKHEPNNKYDIEANQILFNDNCIGYVPNEKSLKNICMKNIDNNIKIINIKREPEKTLV
tara:strand:- start:446 stop:622 length:177 start_codon:yes stop_codon:yes gene_type:complete